MHGPRAMRHQRSSMVSRSLRRWTDKCPRATVGSSHKTRSQAHLCTLGNLHHHQHAESHNHSPTGSVGMSQLRHTINHLGARTTGHHKCTSYFAADTVDSTHTSHNRCQPCTVSMLCARHRSAMCLQGKCRFQGQYCYHTCTHHHSCRRTSHSCPSQHIHLVM